MKTTAAPLRGAPGWLLIALILLCGRAADAGQLEYNFVKPDTKVWELHGITEADFTKDGLRFSWPKGKDRKPKSIVMLGDYLVDDMEILADLDRSKTRFSTRTIIVLDNPEKKRRAELSLSTRPPSNITVTDCNLSYFKNGQSVGVMSGWVQDRPVIDKLRLRKVSKRLFGAFPSRHTEKLIAWITTHYPRTDFDEDCDEYRIIIKVVPPASGDATEVVLKKLTVKGPQVGAKDAKDDEPTVMRFDFGPPQQEVAEGYAPISQYTKYSKGRGYGWKTDLTPMTTNEYSRMGTAEALSLGYEPSVAEEGWRVYADEVMTWSKHVKLRPLLSVAHGWDRIEELGKTYDLKTPQAKDLVFAARHYGFPKNYRVEADQWERRGAIYVDDDLSTEFLVDLPNGRYNAIVGVGLTIGGSYHGTPTSYSIDAEGHTVLKKLNQDWMRCNRFLINDIEVKDGQLNLRFFADRRIAMNVVEPAVVGVGWLINYLIICSAEDPEIQRQEEWRLILERSKRVRQLTFEPGTPATVGLVDGYMQINGKPYLPMVLQYGYQWPRTTYGLYTWANCYTEGLAVSEIGGSSAFFRRDWERMSMWDNYPWRAIASMNSASRRGALDFLTCGGLIYIVPRAIQGEGGKLQDRRGRHNRWQVQPPLGSRLAMEIIRESYTMVSNQLKLHPAQIGFYVYEEFIHPYGYGYDYQSLGQYRDYLKEQYPNIETLNADWGRKYKSFDEVAAPKRDWVPSPEWRNFWKFRRSAMNMQVKKACEMVASLEPEHTTMGQKCKPDPVSTSWHPAANVEMFGGVGPPPSFGAASKFFKRALTQGGGYWDCPWTWVDGRRQLDHKPKARRYLGKHLLSTYNDTISKYFQGTKGFWNEEYNDGVRHMFHRTDLMRRDGPKGKIKTWFGDIVFFDKEAMEFAPVTVCLPPLRFSRAVQLGYRLGPIFLPAQPVAGSVALIMTEDSWLIKTGAAGNHIWMMPIDRILKELHVPYDVLRAENIDLLKDSPVAMVAGFTEAVDPKLVEALKTHVARGGKVIMMDHALGYDARTLSVAKPAPAFGFDKVAGCTYEYDFYNARKIQGSAVVTGGKFIKSVKVGDTMIAQPVTTTLIPAEGATVVAKVDKHVVGVMNADANVLTLSLPHLRTSWQGMVAKDDTLTGLFSDAFETWGVLRPISLTDDAPRDVEVRAMRGKDCWLAAFLNHADKKQSVKATMSFLPEGKYDVVDVTGERPLIVKDGRNGMHLTVDEEFRKPRWIMRDVGNAELAKQGLSLEIDGLMARVLLIRPAGQKVWVNAPTSTLQKMTERAGVVVVGDNATEAELAAAAKIIDAAKTLRGTTLVLRRARDIKIEKTRNEVWVSSTGLLKPKTKADGYLVDVFENAPLLVDSNLIVLGRAQTNGLIRHLAAPNTFTYDKVLEKITPDYPGKGRGLIEMIESVNKPDYNTSSFNHDAILVGGSDDAGVTAAADRFVRLLTPADPR